MGKAAPLAEGTFPRGKTHPKGDLGGAPVSIKQVCWSFLRINPP